VMDGLVQRHASDKQLIQGRSRHVDVRGELLDRHRHPLPNDVGAPVIRLRFGSRPSAIAGGVSDLILNSIEGHALGPSSHIGEEVFERCKPPVADGNPLPAIREIVGVGFIVASLFHRLPRSICRRSSHAMRSVHVPREFPLQAAAAFGVAGRQFVAGLARSISAIAQTDPARSFAVARCARARISVQHDEFAVSNSSAIHQLTHRGMTS
jgi:hypothetical protein